MNKINNVPQFIVINEQKQEPQEIIIASGQNESVCCVVLIAGVSGSYTINLKACGNGAHAQVIVLPLLWKNQCVDIQIVQEHVESQSTSSVYLYGALAGSAHVSCRCTTIIDRNLKQVHTVQKSTVLLLGAAVSVRFMPALTTFSQEIVAEHGAAIGSFDQNQLAFLETKGIDEDDAKKLLLRGFLEQGFSHSAIHNISEYFATELACAIDQLLG
jgi:Fe-S cluster assembly scaffold protein SufB